MKSASQQHKSEPGQRQGKHDSAAKGEYGRQNQCRNSKSLAHVLSKNCRLGLNKCDGCQNQQSQPRNAQEEISHFRLFQLLEEPACEPDTPLWEVADRMLKERLSHMAVVDNGKPVGIVARHDLLNAYSAE